MWINATDEQFIWAAVAKTRNLWVSARGSIKKIWKFLVALAMKGGGGLCAINVFSKVFSLKPFRIDSTAVSIFVVLTLL